MFLPFDNQSSSATGTPGSQFIPIVKVSIPAFQGIFGEWAEASPNGRRTVVFER
jgi:hypothetical protein